MKPPELSIVIPAFNEKDRLPSFLQALSVCLAQLDVGGEILVVDDGSDPAHRLAYQALTRSITEAPIRVLTHSRNLGKGAAIRTGFQEAKGAWVGFADADGSTSAAEILRLAGIARSAPALDGVFGSRIMMLGYDVVRRTKRHLMGRIFASLAFACLRVPVYDSQCGCKWFRRSTVLPLLELCREQRWLLDIELITIGYRKRLRFLEVPISWRDVAASKVHVLRDGVRMAVGLWAIRKRLRAAGIL